MPVVLEAAKLLGALLASADAAGDDFLRGDTEASGQVLALVPCVYQQSISSNQRIGTAGLQVCLLPCRSVSSIRIYIPSVAQFKLYAQSRVFSCLVSDMYI